jgi:YfiH family protein
MHAVNKDAWLSSGPGLRAEGNRTLLFYAALDLPSLRHGIAVFKDVPAGMDHRAWTDTAGRYLRSHLRPTPANILMLRQVHSDVVIDADGFAVRYAPVGDALVSASPLTALAISVSDCVPLFAVDADRRVIGLAHCGWKGIAKGMVEGFVGALVDKGAGMAETVFLIGASIGPCCYEVREDLLARFPAAEVRKHSRSAGRSVVFDLKAVVVSRLTALGALPERIWVDKTCTSCNKYVLCSYRADGRDCGRMLAFLMLTGSGGK